MVSPQIKWSSPLTLNNDVSGFVKICLDYRHLLTGNGIKVDLLKLKTTATRMVSVLFIDRKMKKRLSDQTGTQ